MRIRTGLRMAAVIAALAGGSTAGVGLPAGETVLAGGGGCLNYQLLVTPDSDNSAMGHINEMFRIHDLLPGSCTLFGYPGALLLDGSFHSMPTHLTRAPWPQGGPGPKRVTLTRSRDAYFVLAWEHMPRPGQRCPGARYVMITPPNDRLPVVTYSGNRFGSGVIDACGGDLTASPVAGTPFWS